MYIFISYLIFPIVWVRVVYRRVLLYLFVCQTPFGDVLLPPSVPRCTPPTLTFHPPPGFGPLSLCGPTLVPAPSVPNQLSVCITVYICTSPGDASSGRHRSLQGRGGRRKQQRGRQHEWQRGSGSGGNHDDGSIRSQTSGSRLSG